MANGHHTTVPNGMAGRCQAGGQSQHQNDHHAVYWLGMLIVAGLILGAIQLGCIPSNALMNAASFGDTATVNELLTEGVDVNVHEDRDGKGRTALIYAAQWGHTEVVQVLLTNKADVNVQTNGGLIALMIAVQNGNKQIVQDLLAKEANVTLQANNGEMALNLQTTDRIAQLLKAAGSLVFARIMLWVLRSSAVSRA